jgi:hypothetical protein
MMKIDVNAVCVVCCAGCVQASVRTHVNVWRCGAAKTRAPGTRRRRRPGPRAARQRAARSGR